MCKQPLTLLHPLTCLHLCDVDEVVFGRRGQHLPIMAEAEGSHRPIQSTPQQINTRERGGGESIITEHSHEAILRRELLSYM